MPTSWVWLRFRGLSWGKRILVLSATTLAVLGAVLVPIITAGGGNGGGAALTGIEREQPTSEVAEGRPTSLPTTRTATPNFLPTRTPEPRRTAPPVEMAYRLTPITQAAGCKPMAGFSMIPGSATDALVLDQDGVICKVSLEGDGTAEVFGDIRDRMISQHQYEEGLLGLAFSPNFLTDREIYLYYTAGNPRRSVLSRFSVSNGKLDMASEFVLLEVPEPYSTHNGGQLVFGPDGYLYVALGDGGFAGGGFPADPHGHGQNLSTLLGTILRLDVSGENYAIPPDNPFVGHPNARPEIYAYGLRNPWRFSFDSVTGDMWAGDVGQDRWEEVDRIVAGGNYGWSILEGQECFRQEGCDRSGFQPPRVVYGRERGCCVTGGYVYRGVSMPELDGWYVYADYCLGEVWGFNTADDSPPVMLADSDLSISTWGVLPDGELVAVAISGGILRLERNSQ